MIIAIDFDGTMVKHEFPEIGAEVPDAVRVVKKLAAAGHQLILWTVRGDSDTNGYLSQAVQWFRNREILLYGINRNPAQGTWSNSRKAYAELYIDDAALGCPLLYFPGDDRPFVDWNRVEMILEKKGLFEA